MNNLWIKNPPNLATLTIIENKCSRWHGILQSIEKGSRFYSPRIIAEIPTDDSFGITSLLIVGDNCRYNVFYTRVCVYVLYICASMWKFVRVECVNLSVRSKILREHKLKQIYGNEIYVYQTLIDRLQNITKYFYCNVWQMIVSELIRSLVKSLAITIFLWKYPAFFLHIYLKTPSCYCIFFSNY